MWFSTEEFEYFFKTWTGKVGKVCVVHKSANCQSTEIRRRTLSIIYARTRGEI